MPTSIFSTTGRFYRGNLHTHSTKSDGALEPQTVCDRYRAEGYDFIALTDRSGVFCLRHDHCTGAGDRNRDPARGVEDNRALGVGPIVSVSLAPRDRH